MIIDAWKQQPTGRHPAHEMFASLRRWIDRTLRRADIAPEMTVRRMGVGHVRRLDGLRRRGRCSRLVIQGGEGCLGIAVRSDLPRCCRARRRPLKSNPRTIA
jgi:hypothetical protein